MSDIQRPNTGHFPSKKCPEGHWTIDTPFIDFEANRGYSTPDGCVLHARGQHSEVPLLDSANNCDRDNAERVPFRSFVLSREDEP